MVPLNESQRQAIQKAGWTEEEVQGFSEDIERFRGTLGDKQRAAFDNALVLASEAATGDEVSGFLVTLAVIAIIDPGPLLPHNGGTPNLPVYQVEKQAMQGRPAAQ